MSTLYQPKRGGVIEVVSEEAASDLVVDVAKKSDSLEDTHPEEKFINDYIKQNSKRVQSATSSIPTASSSLSCHEDPAEQQEVTNNQRRTSRHASARRLWEINEWNEQQKQFKQKFQTTESNTNSSYNEIKATTKELLKNTDQLINRNDFEANRRREFIYRNYYYNVREPVLHAKGKQCERLEKTRTNRNRFKTQQYNQFLEFINKHRFITRDDFDTREYDALARYDDKAEEIHTRFLSDPTLLSYRKWLNERRTLSSLGCRPQAQKADDPRHVISDDFRSFHRTTTPYWDGHDSQSALSWQTHDQSVIDSHVRRLASAKCYYIVQQSEDSITCDPIDRSFSYLRHRSASSSNISTRNCAPTPS
ncbi:unnamed protein product [Adineta steineri]|uniref:Uncharacterized protein n=1 Tax=Adineta steineri TaxID=433720 RepID=A0A813QYH4_9BILA|nr:unnamed protein product [Adineta steineri]CAF3793491.1 unnamed protein product [Adineta steineri]